MKEYKYPKKCPHCGNWIVLALSDKQRYLPNIYTEAEGFKRKEGHSFDLKQTILLLETVEEVNELIEELKYHKRVRLQKNSHQLE